MKGYKEIFSDTCAILELFKKADRVTRKRHSEFATLERALFLSWWCDIGSCKFCFMAAQQKKIPHPEKARRKIQRVLAEAEVCRRLGWNIEFLSGGYGVYSPEEIKEIAEMVACVAEAPVWLNTGIMSMDELSIFGDEIEGIVGSVETVNRKIHKEICPDKPMERIEKMLENAKDAGFKTGITIILGLGEKIDDLEELFEFIENHRLDRITFYSLNPHRNTIYANSPSPPSIYQAGVIALTRVNFPDIEIIGGTWIDQLSNVGLLLIAGANGITKYPLFSMLGNRYGKKVEEEVRYANRKLLGTFTDIDILRGIKKLDANKDPNFVFGKKKPEISSNTITKMSLMNKEKSRMVEEYVELVEKRLSAT